MGKTIYDERYRRLITLLRNRREALGLRQADVARRTGWALATESRIEQGQSRLDLLEALELARTLGLSGGQLLAV